MTWRGTVRGGVIVPEEGAHLKDGQVVQIVMEEVREPSNWGDVFSEFVGAVDNLPSDFAKQHDHYIHGTPKR